MHVGLSTSVIQRGKTGIAQYVFALVRALTSTETPKPPWAEDLRLTLFVLQEDMPLFEFAHGRAQIEVVPEEYRPAVKDIVWHQTELPLLAKRLQLDLLHVPSYRRLLWRKPCPLVATIHDLAPFHVSAKYDWKRMFYGKVIVRRLAHRQDQVIAISENTARDIERFFRVPRNRLHVVPNGVDHSRFFPLPHLDPGLKHSSVDRPAGDKPFFLYIARLEHPGKNHVPLIGAFDQFKSRTGSSWQLVFGGSDWHGAQEIYAAAKASRFSCDIHFAGYVPDAALPDWYRSAGALVYPSLYEGFGMPPVEAMACGCPVIASTRGALGEVVGNAAALVDPADINSMATQLEAVADSPELRATLRHAGLIRAHHFDWKVTARRTWEVYNRAAGRAAVPQLGSESKCNCTSRNMAGASP